MAAAETESFTRPLYGFGCAMDRHLLEWKLGIDRIWSAATPDYHEAACLAAEIAGASSEAMLRQAATQALPILRSASHDIADAATLDAARRRLGVVREVLHALAEPRFGKRELAAKLPTPEERHRQTLGLPFDRGLTLAEIHRAFKRAAKSAHPDAGGNAQAFLELTAARDALMHPGSKKGE
jgi:hypothetical protein